MPKLPCSQPIDSPACDVRLPQYALNFRMTHSPPLISQNHLAVINITAWLYRDPQGFERIEVNPNTTIAELVSQFGPAETPDAEVGFHSEGKAAEWFRTRPEYKVLQIFSERVPCAKMCAPLLRHYFPGIPWYYYFDRNSWRSAGGGQAATVAQILKTAYGL